MRRNLFLLAGVAAGVAVGAACVHEALAKYEEPAYTIVARDGNFEVRRYPSVIAAEVTVGGGGSRAADDAFRILAGYIFGKNKNRDKIAMTVPVTEQMQSQKIAMTVPVTTRVEPSSMQMRFFMPSKYTLETLPVPMDDRIQFSTVPPVKYAVVRFSGLAHEGAIRKQADELRAFMRKQNLEAAGDAVRAFYNPPWTLPFLRRNEVWIPLKD